MNIAFAQLLGTLYNGIHQNRGPQRKHADPNGLQTPIYPCFVLQLLTPSSSDFDVLAKSDKTEVTFRNPEMVEQAVAQFFVDVISKGAVATPASPDSSRVPSDTLSMVVDAPGKSSYRSVPKFTTLSPAGQNFSNVFLPSPVANQSSLSKSCTDPVKDTQIDDAKTIDIALEAQDSDSDTDMGLDVMSKENWGIFDHYASRDCASPRINWQSNDYSTINHVFQHETADPQGPDRPGAVADSIPNDAFPNVSLFCGKVPKMSLTKAGLASASIVGQVDLKYILLQLQDVLVAADQHAVDERVRLEGMHDSVEKVVKLNLDLKLPKEALLAIENHQQLLKRWGFGVLLTLNSDKCELISVPVVNGEALTASDLLEFLASLSSATTKLPDAICKPPAIHRILSSHACRQALKFGDRIDPDKAEEMVKRLAATNMPFQCAHGRPSMTPVVNMNSLNSYKRPRPKYQRLFS